MENDEVFTCGSGGVRTIEGLSVNDFSGNNVSTPIDTEDRTPNRATRPQMGLSQPLIANNLLDELKSCRASTLVNSLACPSKATRNSDIPSVVLCSAKSICTRSACDYTLHECALRKTNGALVCRDWAKFSTALKFHSPLIM